MAAVTNANESTFVLDHLLDAESFAGRIIEGPLDDTIAVTDQDLTLVRANKEFSALSPAMCCVILRDVAIFLLIDRSRL